MTIEAVVPPHAMPSSFEARRSVSSICIPFSQRDQLILIRGLPGSGKSTRAKALAMVGFEHFEADMFFERDGVYEYDSARIRDAHAWCQKRARQALACGKRVVVSNTFTRLQEMEPYRKMAERVRVVEVSGNWGNVHGVPAAAVQRMAKRWEALSDEGSATHLNGQTQT